MLEKSFNPAEAEKRLYEAWESSGVFKPRAAKPTDTKADNYSIVIPPPNVTGSLHMGHALNNTLQDILVRFNRMRGKAVLWQPGTDHAGIATQMVVERKMAAEGGPQRKDMSREDFEARVWEWKAESGGNITQQLRRLGASCDWSREKFTLGDPTNPDDKMVEAVTKVFVEMYEQGLIYRDKRLVNWDPKFQTAISDLEVETKTVDGHYWHLRYPLADGVTYEHPITDEDGKVTGHETRGYIVVATSRPETMLGDTGVAVHPDDERYAGLVGKEVILPIVNRRIPIISDDYADPEKGSGAVKITPAHDFNDYDVGKRAGHTPINLLDESAHVLALEIIPEEYHGKSVKEARKMVVAAFDAAGLLQETEDLKIEQPVGDRSGVVIEPMLTDQWFVDAKTLAVDAIEAVDNGKTKFVPANWKKTYDNWMHDIQPWCISRQLWWGHQVPVWYGPKKIGSESKMLPALNNSMMFCCHSEDELKEAAAQYYSELTDRIVKIEIYTLDKLNKKIVGHEAGGADRDAAFPMYEFSGDELIISLYRDPDVLDTWFSSGLWPFSTLGWPENTEELERFYPGSVLVTAFDIIFFWVARMMMQGIHFMGEVPFKDVYIHALVLDEKGQKMSKSKGNVVNPLELIDTYGADALRFTMAAMAAQGRNVRLSTQRIEGYRNFGTKLWNAARFAEMNGCVSQADFDPSSCTQSVNQWIVSEAVTTVKDVTKFIEDYRFDAAADAAYKFAWGTYCDWYLELIKPIMGGEDGAAKTETQAATAWALDQILKLLHPFMPFITEELWANTAPSRDSKLIITAWPDLGDELINVDAADDINWLVRLISAIRSVRSEMNVPPSKKAPLLMLADALDPRLSKFADNLERMARVDGVEAASEAPKGALQTVVDGVGFAIPLEGLIDMDAEKARLSKEIAKVNAEIEKIDKKLGNEAFMAKAPEKVVSLQNERRAAFSAELEQLSEALANLA
ncbi:MAG: valine--tRNA ligase [Litorimonas sp.]